MRDWAYLILCVTLFKVSNDPTTYMDEGAYKPTSNYKLDRKIKRNFERLIARTQEEYEKLDEAIKRKIYRYQEQLLATFIRRSPEMINLETIAIVLWHTRFRERGSLPLHESLQWTQEANVDYISDLLEKCEIPPDMWGKMIDLAYGIAWEL